jgi:flagellar biosynthetic protein FlhB
MADSAQNRTLPATERKLQKAREEGNIARSRDLAHFAVLGAVGLALLVAAPGVVADLQRLVGAGLSFDAQTLASPARMVERLVAFGGQFLRMVLPLGLLALAVALLAGMACGGWNFTWKAVQPRWSKLDPLAGLGRLFSPQQFGQALKACLLALVLGGIGALFLHANLDRFAAALAMPLPAGLAHVGGSVWAGGVLLLLALGAFALVDVPLQRQLWLKRLRMSHEELKKELKDVEGNTEVKAKIKARMREMANRRMLAAVPKADLVVMNPTHFAVALRYDEATMAAPRVVAKGADFLAQRIRDAAHAADVPVLQAPPLARALYAHAEIDREIPAALFSAVAQVLAWVYQLRAALAGQAEPPPPAPQPEVPPELDPANARPAPEADA